MNMKLRLNVTTMGIAFLCIVLLLCMGVKIVPPTFRSVPIAVSEVNEEMNNIAIQLPKSEGGAIVQMTIHHEDGERNVYDVPITASGEGMISIYELNLEKGTKITFQMKKSPTGSRGKTVTTVE